MKLWIFKTACNVARTHCWPVDTSNSSWQAQFDYNVIFIWTKHKRGIFCQLGDCLEAGSRLDEMMT